MKIRKAILDDFEALKKFKILSKKEELKYSQTLKPLKDTKAKYLSYLKTDLSYKSRAMFIAVEDNKIIGMIMGKGYSTASISKFKRKGYISNLYIDKNYRKKGVGVKLLKHTLRWLKKNGVPHVTTEIHIKNLPAQNLMHKAGFKDYTIKMTQDI
ncbi:GNAT family N-acetyltransferase [Candidatus Woesearchaeota archaeon]|nr:GNAT family N-acetyltransferase [Candidatus Woesearchaeota archaeon]